MTLVAACVILKDAADTIARCLASIRPHVDEVNIYDTGSTDGTLELLDRLATEPGPPLRVERGEWRDDFAWARERSFAMVSPDVEWIIWLDADDVLVGGPLLPVVVANVPDTLPALLAVYDAYDDPDRPGERVLVDRTRLVRRDAGYVWEGVVHEDLFGPQATSRIDPRALHVRHLKRASHDPASLARNRAILERADPESDPRVLYYLGLHARDDGDDREGSVLLRRFLAATDPSLMDGVSWSGIRQVAVEILRELAAEPARESILVGPADALLSAERRAPA